MFMPLSTRCAVGAFSDDATGICGTLEFNSGPGKRAEEDNLLSAGNSTTIASTEDHDTLTDMDPDL